jgi:hypothetical protein
MTKVTNNKSLSSLFWVTGIKYFVDGKDHVQPWSLAIIACFNRMARAAVQRGEAE